MFRVKKAKLKKLLWKCHFNKLALAFNAWINHTANIDIQVRL